MHFVCRKKTISWRTKFLKTYKLHNFYGFLAIFFWDMDRSFSRVTKAAHYVLRNCFKKNSCFEQTLKPELFRIRKEKISTEFLKNFRRFQRKFFTEKHFFKIIMSFSALCRSFSRILARNVLARCSKLHISCPEEHDSRKKTAFWKGWFLIKFGTGTNFFLMPQGKVSSAQWKVQSTCSQKHSGERMFSFLTQTYFSRLGTLTEAFLELSDKKKFVNFWKTAFNVSGGSIWWKFFFSET